MHFIVKMSAPNASLYACSYLTSDSESHTQETTVRTLSNGSGPTAFGVCMKKL
jgi:hypothetical protein